MICVPVPKDNSKKDCKIWTNMDTYPIPLYTLYTVYIIYIYIYIYIYYILYILYILYIDILYIDLSLNVSIANTLCRDTQLVTPYDVVHDAFASHLHQNSTAFNLTTSSVHKMVQMLQYFYRVFGYFVEIWNYKVKSQ